MNEDNGGIDVEELSYWISIVGIPFRVIYDTLRSLFVAATVNVMLSTSLTKGVIPNLSIGTLSILAAIFFTVKTVTATPKDKSLVDTGTISRMIFRRISIGLAGILTAFMLLYVQQIF